MKNSPRHKAYYLLTSLMAAAVLLSACDVAPTANPGQPTGTATNESLIATSTYTPEPPPPKVLSICIGQEPDSLFQYSDSSVGAGSVRAAIYDGPFDIRNYEMVPVILERKPSFAGGDAFLEAVNVEQGEVIVDHTGELVALSEGAVYLPAGCREEACAQTYAGDAAVQIDQLVVRFKLLPGIRWSDGAPLTANDSVYSYRVAKDLFPAVSPQLIRRTAGYQALDDATVEWRGIPGYIDTTYYTNFFSPLPQHVWGGIPADGLLTAEASSRTPLGWGPYVIDQWVVGDHISLSRNDNYFRTSEGLPAFDRLVFRFVASGEQAITALLAGECDFIDETVPLDENQAELAQLQTDGELTLAYETGTAWEHIDFGILPADPEKYSPFQDGQVRRAIAMCIDRQSLVDELFSGRSSSLETYAPPLHPLSNPEAQLPGYDPQAAIDLLQSAGWVDADNDPGTPRVANGISGIPDGTPLAFSYLFVSGIERELAAQRLKESLVECGIQIELKPSPMQEVFAPGPQGPVFGRNFEMAQFGWVTSLEPPCFLYTSNEIPGPYPEYEKGWGGANAGGYSNPEYDLACRQARFSLPDFPEHQAAHNQAQAIFVQDVPVVPLYLRLKQVVMRPDMCGVSLDPSASNALWNLESFDYGESCSQ